jgi:hypothetical protein
VIANLQAIAAQYPSALWWPVFIDVDGVQVSVVELDERTDKDGPWLALVAAVEGME